MDFSAFDFSGMTEAHRGLVDACFRVAFAEECVPSRMSDAQLAALLRLRLRIINNFGLYVLANPDTELTFESLHESLAALAEDALSRLQGYRNLSDDRAMLVAALSECNRLGFDSDEVCEEVARFVDDAAREQRSDGSIGRAVLQLAGTVRLASSDRAYALGILRGWISTMAADGSWPDMSDREALERCRMLSDVAIPGYVVRAELIDRCYLRYVMRDDSLDQRTNLLRIVARCAHYTDIEVDYADADIAFLVDTLNDDIPIEMRTEAYEALFDVLLQLYALDLMELIDFDSGHDPESTGTEYPRA